jgi:hypothetical protein
VGGASNASNQHVDAVDSWHGAVSANAVQDSSKLSVHSYGSLSVQHAPSLQQHWLSAELCLLLRVVSSGFKPVVGRIIL